MTRFLRFAKTVFCFVCLCTFALSVWRYVRLNFQDSGSLSPAHTNLPSIGQNTFLPVVFLGKIVKISNQILKFYPRDFRAHKVDSSHGFQSGAVVWVVLRRSPTAACVLGKMTFQRETSTETYFEMLEENKALKSLVSANLKSAERFAPSFQIEVSSVFTRAEFPAVSEKCDAHSAALNATNEIRNEAANLRPQPENPVESPCVTLRVGSSRLFTRGRFSSIEVTSPERVRVFRSPLYPTFGVMGLKSGKTELLASYVAGPGTIRCRVEVLQQLQSRKTQTEKRSTSDHALASDRRFPAALVSPLKLPGWDTFELHFKHSELNRRHAAGAR